MSENFSVNYNDIAELQYVVSLSAQCPPWSRVMVGPRTICHGDFEGALTWIIYLLEANKKINKASICDLKVACRALENVRAGHRMFLY